MINVLESSREQLTLFSKMEKEGDISRFISTNTPSEHVTCFEDPNYQYLTILTADKIVGFIVLVLEEDSDSVEFRRIVVLERGNGVGQDAILAMEGYCKNVLKRKRIWLDVYQFNKRGRHIYEKLNYLPFKKEKYEGQTLYFYEKRL